VLPNRELWIFATSQHGNEKNIGATQTQQRAICVISKSLNLDMNAVLADLNVTAARSARTGSGAWVEAAWRSVVRKSG
jgi:hypothetical protein